ncbi:MAG: RDD family protein [Psychroserpens sp.]|uniref:RDD family protein n=1 Tax=Psychroserpens sp. TaxID=2020870 RepID=UPI0030027DB2
MKITHTKYPEHNLANETERGENLGIDFILSSILGILVVSIIYIITPYANLGFEEYLKGFGVYLSVRFVYYFGFELLYSRTPGKFQTQTKVVNKDGVKPNIFQLLIRNISRFISVFSGISDDERAIHDTISNTFVIQDSKLKRIASRQTMILLFNLLLGVFWIYFFTKKSGKSSAELALLIALILATIYALIVGIRRIGSKVNIKKYR